VSDPGQIPPAAETLESQGAEDVLSNEDLTAAAAAGLRWVAYARFAIEAMLFVTMVALARIVPPEAFGIFAVVTIVQELAQMMPMEGIGGALVQRRSIERDHLRGGLTLSVGLGLLGAAFTVLVAVLVVEPLMGRQTEMLTIATTPYFLLGAVYAIPMAVLRRRLDFRRLSLIDLALNATRALASLALALVGLNASALVFGSMLGMAAALCMALAFAPVPLPAWRPRAMRELLPYGGPAALATISWTGFRNGDYAIIGSVLGPAQAGFYWRSYQLAVEYQGKVANAVSQVAFPVLARTEGIDELLVLRQRMVRLLTVLVFPLLALLIVLAPTVIPWLFGPEWEPSVVPTQILVAGGAATLAINTCGSALMAAGRARALLGYGVAHFVVYAGAVLVVAHQGIEAVAIAGSVVHSVFLLVAYFVLLRGRGQSTLGVLWRDLAPALVGCTALALAAVPAARGLEALGTPVLPLMAGVGLAGGAAYLLALRLLFPASAADLMAAIARLLPKRLGLGGRRLGPPVAVET
jgi:O-antigen/teichoic acid export membrane protein